MLYSKNIHKNIFSPKLEEIFEYLASAKKKKTLEEGFFGELLKTLKGLPGIIFKMFSGNHHNSSC